MCAQKALEIAAANLLLAFKHTLHIERQGARCAQITLNGFQMNKELPFVVRGASSVQITVADHRLERRSVPITQSACGLNVIVAIDQHSRPPRRMQPIRRDDGMPDTSSHPHIL